LPSLSTSAKAWKERKHAILRQYGQLHSKMCSLQFIHTLSASYRQVWSFYRKTAVVHACLRVCINTDI
jgi:hypothetical protein